MDLIIIDFHSLEEELSRNRSDLLSRYFTQNERKTLPELRMNRRCIEHLAGMLAAKEAVIFKQEDNTQLNAIDIEIDHKELGEPIACLSDESRQTKTWEVSISHSGSYAVAAVSSNEFKIGVDIQKLFPSTPSFRQRFFTQKELVLMDSLVNLEEHDESEVVTQTWSIKEAVSKCLGLGIKAAIDCVEVISFSAQGMSDVNLKGQAKKQFMKMGGVALGAKSTVWLDYSVAVGYVKRVV